VPQFSWRPRHRVHPSRGDDAPEGSADICRIKRSAGGCREHKIELFALASSFGILLLDQQPTQASGNQDGWMIVPLPLSESDPVRRLQLIADETAERKHKPRPRTGSGVPLLFQRAFLRGFRRQRLLNTSVTNLPGPPVPLYLAGARLLELVPVVSLMGNLTLVVAVLSYTGQLNLTAVADRDTCPDVEIFAQGVQGTLDQLAGSVLGASFVNGGEIPLEASSDARSEHS
jgi:diacylglycerol O-acyltransferase